jgi:hypothetical protein
LALNESVLSSTSVEALARQLPRLHYLDWLRLIVMSCTFFTRRSFDTLLDRHTANTEKSGVITASLPLIGRRAIPLASVCRVDPRSSRSTIRSQAAL